ncbi:MAG: metallophosphoesterase [Candidatus Pacearchaeota archaeon]|jgi:DNA polymerase II small subunit
MNTQEILKFCFEKGFLLDSEVLNLFSETNDAEAVKIILEKIRSHTNQKIITKNVFQKNRAIVNKFFMDLPRENQKKLEKLKINLGLSIEISHESEIIDNFDNSKNSFVKNSEKIKTEKINENVEVSFQNPTPGKKLEVIDFVKYFRNRFNKMREILQEHSELDNLVSINKILNDRSRVSVIGLVSEKRVTKNKNIILDIEDLTGTIRVLINKDKKEIYEKAEEIALDSIVGFKGSGNREILFANEVIFPEAILLTRKKSPKEEYALFIGDLHYGSKRFLEKSFLKFIDYLNGKVAGTKEEVEKIKYLIVAGDIITGVGNYPNQENDLKVMDLEEQYLQVAELFRKIRSDIKIIISPGNHEGVRLMEPQPIFDEKYAWPLYELDNVILVPNPSEVKIGLNKNFNGFNVLIYHGFSYFYYVNNVARLMKMKAANSPEEIMKYLLRQRHLAPTHASVQYFPSVDTDYHLISNIPDILVSAHTHKSAVTYYNNILLVSTSCWEAMTPYQEKFGNTPDHCKVPMVNLKTRSIKILDFEEEEKIEV